MRETNKLCKNIKADSQFTFESEVIGMISDEQLESLRQSGVKVRVVRDANPENDVQGYIVAWDDKEVLLRRPNRRVVKLSREYTFEIMD